MAEKFVLFSLPIKLFQLITYCTKAYALSPKFREETISNTYLNKILGVPFPIFWLKPFESSSLARKRSEGGTSRGCPPVTSPMPGRWVGGRGSLAAPTKGTYIEAEVFDDSGKPQGTVLLFVKKLVAPGETGRTIHADLITATDSYYRFWITTPAGAVTTVDGAYHLCKGKPHECSGGGKADYVVHLGKWRNWKETEFLEEQQTEFIGPAKALLMAYMKGSRSTDHGDAELPWGDKPGKGSSGLHIARQKAEKAEKEKKAKEATGPESEKKKRIASLREELEKLKKEVAAEEKSKEEAASKPKAPASPKDRKSLFTGGLTGLGHKENEEKDADDSSSSPRSSSTSRSRSRGRRPKGEKGTRKVEKERKRKVEKKGSKKEKKRKKKRRRDRGPFGLEPSVEASSKDSSEEDSEDTEESFRKAPAGFLRLQRYAQRHPGKLAARLLHKMKAAGRYPVGALRKKVSEETQLEPALAYYQSVMVPNLKDSWTPRTQREMKYMVILLDLLAESKASQVADQRLKALEKSVLDRNQWKRAKYLELVEPEEGMLADRGEEQLMQKELEREDRLKSPTRWGDRDRGRWKGKGENQEWSKGKPKGDRKGKSKGKTPVETVAEQKK